MPFLTGNVWSSTSAEPKYGILPFILTSVYGTAGAIVLGVPIGFLTAVYLSKVAPKKVRTVLEAAVSLLAGIPSVVYGLVGMLVLVPAIRKPFPLPDERLAASGALFHRARAVSFHPAHQCGAQLLLKARQGG